MQVKTHKMSDFAFQMINEIAESFSEATFPFTTSNVIPQTFSEKILPSSLRKIYSALFARGPQTIMQHFNRRISI